MEDKAQGHEAGSERPVAEQPIEYVCAACGRTFAVPPGAPNQMDGLAIDGLTCPWCGRWAMPAPGDGPVGVSAARPVMRRVLTWAVAVMLAFLVGVLGYLAWAERDDERGSGEEDLATLATAVTGASVSLEQGLASAEGHGTPLSAKFEADEEALQLSVYVRVGPAAFSELFMDPRTGRVVKVESITGGDDLRAAKAQVDAMAKATVPLRAAVERGLKASESSRAIRVMPQLRQGHPVAEITVVKGHTVMTVWERLDQ